MRRSRRDTTRGETDEFVTPTVIGDYGGARDGDGLMFANFRADRAREILMALVDPDFDGFDPGKRPDWSARLGMVEYSEALNAHLAVMFPSIDIVNTLGDWVAERGLRQFRIAETEKYPHVTFFFNGGIEPPEAGEERYMAPSPKVRTYDLQPEMSAAEVTEHLVAAIRSREYDLIVVNYANPDMVGHTGILEAAMRAVEAVDEGLGRVIAALEEVGGAMIVTADHGNCEVMVDPGDRRAAYRAYPQPGAGDPGRRAEGRAATRRAAGGSRAEPVAAHGPAAAARDGRAEPDRGGMKRRGVSWTGLLAAGLVLAGPGAAATPEDLTAAAARLASAGQALTEARGAEDPSVPLVAAIGAYEEALERLRGVVLGAGAREREIAIDLAGRREEIMRLAAALETMSRIPPPAQMIHPAGPLAAARASAVLARLTPALQAEAAELAATLEEIETARRLQREGIADLASGLAALEAARDELGGALAGRVPEDPPQGAVQAGRDAETLTALAGALARQSGGGGSEAVPADAWLWPVRGRVLAGFEVADAAGVRRPGLTVGAPALSLVEAPAQAMVRYAAPFLEYGYVVVLETDDGSLVVLAGLAQLAVSAGTPVARGDLLGLLGGRNLEVEEYVMLPDAEAGAGALETLYIEVRHGGGPVDPEPWFADENG